MPTSDLLVISLLGSSFPADQHVEDAVVQRLPYPVLRYQALLDRYQRGVHLGTLEIRLATLRQAVTDHPECRTVVMGRSSGAITATRLAVAEPSLLIGIVALGYPFCHPDRPPEAERTAHLPGLEVPLLVVQGDCDAYGTARDAFGFGLPPGTRLLQVQGSHELRLSAQEWNHAAGAIRAFVEDLGRAPTDRGHQPRSLL